MNRKTNASAQEQEYCSTSPIAVAFNSPIVAIFGWVPSSKVSKVDPE